MCPAVVFTSTWPCCEGHYKSNSLGPAEYPLFEVFILMSQDGWSGRWRPVRQKG
jgi:hypothetical protein